MTQGRDNSTRVGDIAGGLFGPGVLPPQRGEVSDRARKRQYVPKTYSDAEVNEARRVIAHWNQVFAGVAGASRANPGDACNIKAYVKLLRSITKAEGLFDYIDEAVVKQAIYLYRTDQANGKLGRWKRFSDWLTCESIDFYKSRMRIAEHRKLHVAQARQKEMDRAAKLKRIVTHKHLGQVCTWAAQARVSTLEFLLRPPPRSLGKDEGPDNERQELIALCRRRNGLPPGVRESLSTGARTVFGDYFNRPIGSKPDDAAILEGIELALIDLYPNDSRLRVAESQEAAP